MLAPQYMRIAADLARRIASGEYREGERLSGRGALSTRYQVSPETVRKALKLLSDMDIVKTREGSGTEILSIEKAKSYLETVAVYEEQTETKNQLRTLLQEYTEMGRQIVKLSDRLLKAQAEPVPAGEALPNYEAKVPADSDKIGLTLGELKFWQCTGATVAAIRREDRLMVSPGPYAELKPGDTLVYVGQPECRRLVEHLLGSGATERTLYKMQEQITRSVHAKELEAIARALGAELGEITDIRAMTKGMTNRSFVFRCRDRKYILRIPGEGTQMLINRREEAEVYRAISGQGICDDPVYLNPENGLMVSRFLEPVRVCDPFREEDVIRAVGLMRTLHEKKLSVPHSFPLFDKLLFYEALWEGRPSVFPDYEETRERIFRLRPFIEAHQAPFCLTHIDAVPDNFLFVGRRTGQEQPEGGETEELQLHDWEYAAMQDPHLDIAMFAIYSGYEKEQTDHLTDLYFGGDPGLEIRVKLYCYAAVSALLWSNWCEYKRLKGVEFGAYAEGQYRTAKLYLEIAEESMKQL